MIDYQGMKEWLTRFGPPLTYPAMRPFFELEEPNELLDDILDGRVPADLREEIVSCFAGASLQTRRVERLMGRAEALVARVEKLLAQA